MGEQVVRCMGEPEVTCGEERVLRCMGEPELRDGRRVRTAPTSTTFGGVCMEFP